MVRVLIYGPLIGAIDDLRIKKIFSTHVGKYGNYSGSVE